MLRSMRTALREFRYTRPFWGALLVLFAGLEIGILPLGPTDQLIHAGKGVFVSEICAILLLAMGVVILLVPSQRILAALVAVAAAVASLPLSNLGGWVVGMMAGIIGGSLAFGWVPDKPRRAHWWRRSPEPPPQPPRPRPGAAADPVSPDAVLAGEVR